MEKDFRIRREESVLSAGAAEPYDAVVFGSTGAVGKEVVRSLAQSEQCRSVVAIVRRFTQVTEWKRRYEKESEKKGRDEIGYDFSKVEVKRVNFETIQTSLPLTYMRGKQVVFYCLGTTRSDAGSAANFRKVDLEYLEGVCQLCRVAGVDHFSLVSSQGASASSPFLYFRVKARCEKQTAYNHVLCKKIRRDFVEKENGRSLDIQVVTSAGYPHTSVWRPGLLDRGDKARAVEKIARLIIKPMPVETLGRAMVVDAESKLGTGPEEDPTVLDIKDIQRLADRGGVI